MEREHRRSALYGPRMNYLRVLREAFNEGQITRAQHLFLIRNREIWAWAKQDPVAKAQLLIQTEPECRDEEWTDCLPEILEAGPSVFAQVRKPDGIDAAIEAALQSLTPREEKVIRLRFMDGNSLTEIGEKLWVGKERVRQIEAKAIRKLQHPMLQLQLRPFMNLSWDPFESDAFRAACEAGQRDRCPSKPPRRRRRGSNSPQRKSPRA
jgi:DNA-binding CsgD family transcriptional regulator